MSKPSLTDREIDTIIEMRERGASYAVIGRKLGRSEKAVSWHCLRLGVDPPEPPPLRPDWHLRCPVAVRGNHRVRAFTPDEDRRLLEMEAQGLGYSEIGRALGRKPNSVKGRVMTLTRRAERGVA